MSDQQQSPIQQLNHAADWLTEDTYRWVGMWTGLLVSFVSVVAVAIRFTWRAGGAEPQSRLQYALVETFANILPFAFVLAGAFLVYALVRQVWRSSHA